MGKYAAVALMILATTGQAAALDVGGGGKVGGIGVGAGVSAGSSGVSAGVGATAGGLGGASVGASANSGGVSVGASANAGGASVGASANAAAGSVGAGVSTNTGAATTGTADADSPATPAISSAKGATAAISIPSILKPTSTNGSEFWRSKAGYPFTPLVSLKAKPGTPPKIVSVCRVAIASAATPLGAVRISAVSAGLMRQRKGVLAAPIEVRINYALRGGIQVRQAKVVCRLDAMGKVIAVT